ncbi:MAG TPA: DUF1801 domain-containing protein [Polyangiaceae bacterium]|nr:DUF1801 domain-containing protein [Polyangiaceae bacterium]
MKKTAAVKKSTSSKKSAAPKESAPEKAPRKAPKKSPAPKRSGPPSGKTASEFIDARIAEYPDWRGELLSQLRALVKAADPQVVEEWKWEVPVWSHDGMICTGEVYKSVVKLTFAKGAFLPDPARLFNSSLGGNLRRAIDFHEGEKPSEKAFKTLVRAAVTLNAKPR